MTARPLKKVASGRWLSSDGTVEFIRGSGKFGLRTFWHIHNRLSQSPEPLNWMSEFKTLKDAVRFAEYISVPADPKTFDYQRRFAK